MDPLHVKLLQFQREVLISMRMLLDDHVNKEVIRALIDILHNIPVNQKEMEQYDMQQFWEQCSDFDRIFADLLPGYFRLDSMLKKLKINQ
ncbi:MAG: hypothetical protein Kow00108_24140 [Calditrichia bacterium]